MKRRLVARLACTVLLTVGTAAAAVAPATAEPAAEPAPEDTGADTLLGAMQRDLGLNLGQARERLRQESIADRVREAVRESLGAAYGGSHFDAELGKLVVGVTDRAMLDDVRSQGARARLVEHSAAQLDNAAERLGSRLGNAPTGVTGYFVDPVRNSVVLTTAEGTGAAAERFVNSSGVDASTVSVQETTESPRLYADIVGGNPYYIGGGARCSIGFAVQGGFLSAGHCGNKGDSTSAPAGTFAGSSFPGNDYSYIESSVASRAQVNNYQGGVVQVAGAQEAAVGASVCRSGSTTGWHCGTIQSKNQSVRYSQGTVNGLTRTDVCAEPGDSGGSFVSGNQAQGMTSGGSGDCTNGGTTYFQPVNEALAAYGVNLVTG